MIAERHPDGVAARRIPESNPPRSAQGYLGVKDRTAASFSGLASCRKCRSPHHGDGVAQAVAGPLHGAAICEKDVERFSAMASEILHRMNGAMDAARGELCAGIHFSPSVCHHEAGHAVIAIHFGASVEQVNVDRSCSASPTFGNAATLEAKVCTYQAGNIAETWLTRRIDRPFDTDFAFSIASARARQRYSCDMCLSIRAIINAHLVASDGELITTYRQFEAQTIALVQRPDVWRSIKAVASALAEHGQLDDNGVRSRCEPSVIGGAVASSSEVDDLESYPRFFRGGGTGRVTREFDPSLGAGGEKSCNALTTR
jgi:hypothetical protein